MFEKLKNIKFSLKKKGKGKGDAPAEDVFSSSEDDNFFSEPSFAEDDGSTDDLFGETGVGDNSATDIAADLPEDKSFDEKSKPSPAKTSSSRRTLLLFVLLLLFSAYGAYTYVIPENYPELKKEIDSQIEGITTKVSELISGEAPTEKVEAPKRIAIQKPHRKAIPKPPEKAKELKSEAKKTPAKKEAKVAAHGEGLELVEEKVQKPKVEVKVMTKTAPAKPATKVKAEPAVTAKAEPKKAPAPATKPVTAVKKRLSKKKIKVIRAQLPVSKKGYYIQAGAFIFRDNLNVPKKKIESLGFRPKVKTGTKLIGMHRLLVGAWDDFLIAEDIAAKLKRKGFKAELTSKNERFCVLIGSYYYKKKADRKGKALKAKGFNSRIEKKRIRMKINYLLLGPYATSEKAAEITEVLDTKGLKTAIIQTK